MPRASQRAPLITFCLSYQMPTLPPAVPRRSSDANCIPCLPLQCPLQSPICRPSPPLVHRSGEAKSIPADALACPALCCILMISSRRSFSMLSPCRSGQAKGIPADIRACLVLHCILQSPTCQLSSPLFHRSGEAKGIPAAIRACFAPIHSPTGNPPLRPSSSRSCEAEGIPADSLTCPALLHANWSIFQWSLPVPRRSGEAKGIPADIRASRPTIFCSVPRVLERFEITVMDKASAADFGLPWVHSKARPCGTMGLGPRKCGMAGLGHDSGVPGASTPAQLCRMPAGVDALRCLQHGMAWCTLQVSLPHLVRLDIALVCR